MSPSTTPATEIATHPSTSSIPEATPPSPSPPPVTRTHSMSLPPNPKPRVPFDPSTSHVTRSKSAETEPSSFTVANKFVEWRKAMAEEYSALVRNDTWNLPFFRQL